VVQGVDRTAHLVQQLLTLARLDPATGPGASQTVSLDEVAAHCITELAPTANIDIGLERDARAVVQGDATLLGILLRNLIDNAIRYTPAGGRITVSTARQAERVVWVVTDTGPGIPAAERERVLERFYRVLGTEQAGSGLGLSIVQRIAVLHGATLQLLDTQPGPGLRVEVTFPAIRAH
jgi:two-component system sensor histidine kinase QseC